MAFKFSVDIHKVKTREWITAFSDDAASIELMSQFLVNDKGDSIPQGEAREMLLDTTLDELGAAQESFLTDFARARQIHKA
jgi:hypothetical protein